MTMLSISNRASIPDLAPARVTARRRVVAPPVPPITRMMRYRGGTYSHTVDRIVFTDGTSARTDLIRLNPNMRAYSLDFTGIAPQDPSPYRLGSWSTLPQPPSGRRSRASEVEVDWILRHSFPLRSTDELSQQLRDAGYPLGPANISEHEAIAGTQAAIWYLTNGLTLDTRPLNVPVAVRRGPGPVITFEFDGQPQLGGYSVWTLSDKALPMKLQKSANGVDWRDVSGSQLTVPAGHGRHRKALGVGSTLSTSSHAGGGLGYRFYRLVAQTDSPAPTIGHVSFWLTGSRHYRNADRVVHLYNYLLSGARKALRERIEPGVAPQLDATNATVDSDLVGPFHARIPLQFNATDDFQLLDADGFSLTGVVQPGTEFYLRRPSGSSAATLTATTPHHLPGRVLTGVALERASQQLTPVALAIATDMAIEFDISWEADLKADLESGQAELLGAAEIVGDECK